MPFKKIARWAARRLTERSTYVGLGMAAAALGANRLGMQIDQAGQIIGLVVGTGLAAATTSAAMPAEVIAKE